MIDPEIKTFGERILAWTRRMEPLAALSDKRFCGEKYKARREEHDENQHSAGCDDPANDNDPM